MATCFPEYVARSEREKIAVSLGFAWTWTRKTQCRSFPVAETAKNATIRLANMAFMINWSFSCCNPSMIRSATIFSMLLIAGALAQDITPPAVEQNASPTSPTAVPAATPKGTTTMQKRGLFGRVLHPFSSSDVLPKYNDRKLRGLVLDLQVSPQPVRLSEIRQMEVKVTVTNMGN